MQETLSFGREVIVKKAFGHQGRTRAHVLRMAPARMIFVVLLRNTTHKRSGAGKPARTLTQRYVHCVHYAT